MKKAGIKHAVPNQKRSATSKPKGSAGKKYPPASEHDLEHELRVHQIELETQNEELRHMQREIEAVRQEYQDLYETVPVGCFTLDARGKVLEANLAGIHLLGESPSALIGRRFALFIEERNRFGFAAFCKAVLKDAGGKTCELCLLNRSEGTTRVVQVFGVSVKWQARVDSALRLAVMDITERKQAEEALRRAHEKLEDRVVERTVELVQASERLRSSEREFHLLADNVPAYFSYIDQDLRYRFINKRYGNLFGRPTAELIGQLVKDVVGEANFCTIEPRLREALVGRETSFIYPKVLPNADARWMSVHYTPDRGEPGPITGVLALMIDVTDQKRSELAL